MDAHAVSAVGIGPHVPLLPRRSFLLATEPEFKDGKFTGELSGEPCFKEGKVNKVKNWLEENKHINFDDIYFYTDSHNDIKLLEFCTKPIAVDPDNILKDVSEKNNWKIISLR